MGASLIYTPRTNGKAERFIQTAIREWAYARLYQNSAERLRYLAPWIFDMAWLETASGRLYNSRRRQ